MPTGSHPRIAHLASRGAARHRAFRAGKDRAAAELAGQKDEARRRRLAEREHNKELKRHRQEARADLRILARDLRDEEAGQRQAARDELAALRANPLYDLWKQWGRRVDTGTAYDAAAWRRSGRLVAVHDRNRYTAGGTVRREVVDWTDVLDRRAQELGVHSNDVPRMFEGLRRQAEHAHATARRADEMRIENDEVLRELRAAAQ